MTFTEMKLSQGKIFYLIPSANQFPKKLPESQLFHLLMAYDFISAIASSIFSLLAANAAALRKMFLRSKWQTIRNPRHRKHLDSCATTRALEPRPLRSGMK